MNQSENYDYEKIKDSKNSVLSNSIELEQLLKLKEPLLFNNNNYNNNNNIELMIYFMGIVCTSKASCNSQYYVVWSDENEPILSKESLYETEYIYIHFFNLFFSLFILFYRLSFNVPMLWMKIAESNTTRMIDEVNSLIKIASIHASKLIRKDSFSDIVQSNNILLTNIQENQYLLEKIKNHLESIKVCENVCSEGKINDGNFKPSKLKTEKIYQFIPTNLHYSDYVIFNTFSREILTSDWPFIFPLNCEVYTTSGVPAAQAMKFDHGGINSIVKDLRKMSIPPIVFIYSFNFIYFYIIE